MVRNDTEENSIREKRRKTSFGFYLTIEKKRTNILQCQKQGLDVKDRQGRGYILLLIIM